MQPLDEYDKSLLRLMQQNNLMTSQELGEKVNLSASAVQRRIQKLRSEKIIEADVSLISPEVAGVGLTCIVDVALREDGAKAVDTLMKEIHSSPEVSQCYYVTGTFDLVMVVNTSNMSHYESFTQKYLMNNPLVKSFYTHVVMNRLKMNHAIAI